MGLVAMVLEADPVAVTWTGSPTVTTDCGSCEYFYPTVNELQNGPEADVGESYSTDVFQRGNYQTSATISTPFIITSETAIELAVTADYGAQGSTCNPMGCASLTSWTFMGGFSGSSEIVDSNGNVDLSLLFGQSGSVAANCDSSDCIALLSLASDVNGSVDLAAGTYTLVTYESNSNQSIGDNQSGVGVTESITDPGSPVPEPRWIVGLLISIVLGSRWCWEIQSQRGGCWNPRRSPGNMPASCDDRW